MPWYSGENQTALGVTIANKKADGSCEIDRKLIHRRKSKGRERIWETGY